MGSMDLTLLLRAWAGHVGSFLTSIAFCCAAGEMLALRSGFDRFLDKKLISGPLADWFVVMKSGLAFRSLRMPSRCYLS